MFLIYINMFALSNHNPGEKVGRKIRQELGVYVGVYIQVYDS